MALLGTINTGKQGRTHIFTGTVILAGGILAILTGPFETIVLFRKEQSTIQWFELNEFLFINVSIIIVNFK